MEFKDYYTILGVDEKADAKTIKAAYRKLARLYHPDVSQEKDAETMFKEVNEAYEVLKNDDKRAEYDQLRQFNRNGRFQPPPGWQSSSGFDSSGEPFSQGDFSDFFSSIFGSGDSGFGGFHQSPPRRSKKGDDIEAEIALFLEDTLNDTTKTVEFNATKINALGQRVRKPKSLKVKIPAGVSEGERIRLKNQGAPGINGGANGDLYLRIRFAPHPLFSATGKDLTVTVPVAPWEAALGDKITVPTLNGKVNLTIPPNSQSGQKFRIKGKGLNHKNGSGDLFAQLKIVVPNSNQSLTEHWQALRQASQFNPRSQWL